jgi:hypothetical protein
MQFFGFDLNVGGLHLRFSIAADEQAADGKVRLADMPRLELTRE